MEEVHQQLQCHTFCDSSVVISTFSLNAHVEENVNFVLLMCHLFHLKVYSMFLWFVFYNISWSTANILI